MAQELADQLRNLLWAIPQLGGKGMRSQDLHAIIIGGGIAGPALDEFYGLRISSAA